MYGGLSREEMERRLVAAVQECDISLIEKKGVQWEGLDVYVKKDNDECIAVALSGSDCWTAMSGSKMGTAMPFLEGNMLEAYYDKNTGKVFGKYEPNIPEDYLSDGQNHESLEIAFWWFLGTSKDVADLPPAKQEAHITMTISKPVPFPANRAATSRMRPIECDEEIDIPVFRRLL